MLLVLAIAVGAWFHYGKQGAEDIPTRLAYSAIPAELAAGFSGDNALAHVRALDELGPRPPASPGYEKALAYLEAEFSRHGWTAVRQTFSRGTPKGPVTFTNLLARHTAGGIDWSKSTPVVIGGHLDSKAIDAFTFTGANDGGSSTGVILELARVLAGDPAAAAKVEFVLFDGEEALLPNITPTDGLYGSKYYAHEILKRTSWPALGIVLDLVGDSSHGFYYNIEATDAIAAAVEKAAADSEFKLRRSPGPILDDHVPLQNTGLPCLHIIGDFMNMPYWHQEGDTIEVIDAAALEKTGRTTLRFLAGVAP
nr:M28 family peptidase [Luteolibacter marinus]